MRVMPNSRKVAIFSDIHLGVHMNSPAWHEVSQNWAKWYVADLQDKNIEEVIFCGDFFHNRNEITVNTLHQAGELLDLFKDLKIYMIAGNHDSFYKNNCSVNSIRIFSGRKNIEVIDKPTSIQFFGKECFFAPWGTAVETIPESDVIFGHFEIESFKMNSYKICDHGFKSGDLLGKASLIVSGHFHHREERKYSKGTILYVGSPFELDFGDEGTTKGYYILDFNDLTYQFYENTLSPRHIKINLSDLIKIKDFHNKGKEVFGNNIVKLVVDKTISANDLDRLSTKIGTLKPHSYVIDNAINFDLFGAANQEEIDLSGVDIPRAINEFINLLDIQNKQDITEYTISLYNHCK